MSRNDIANLAFKITGLYCLIQFLSQLHTVITMVVSVLSFLSMGNVPGTPGLSQTSWWVVAGLSGIPVLLLGVLSYQLIARSRKWASLVFPTEQPESNPTSVLAVHALAFSIVGVFVLADSLPEMARNVVWIGLYTAGVAGGGVQWEGWVGMITPAVKLALGLLLLFRAHYLVRWWSRLRYAGLGRKLGICRYCGYSLAANISGVCPECGTPTLLDSEPAKE